MPIMAAFDRAIPVGNRLLVLTISIRVLKPKLSEIF
jgi:hypothetical protein